MAKTRIAVSAPPMHGHMTPLAALAGELAQRGHEVLCIDFFERPFPLPPGVQRVALPSALSERVTERSANNIVVESMRALREFCGEMFPATLQHLRAFKPELLLFDMQLPMAPALSHVLGCPWLYTISTPVMFLDGGLVNSAIEQVINGAYVTLCEDIDRDLGMPPRRGTYSPHGNLCFASPGFVDAGVDGTGGAPVSFIGASLLPRAPNADDEALAQQVQAFNGRKLYVSLGSVMAHAQSNRASAVALFRSVLLSHNEPGCLLLFSAPDELLAEAFAGIEVQATVIARSFVNQPYLLPLFDLIFGHAGYNTVAESLYHGIPTVAFPFVFDQTRNAHRLEQLGVGVRVSRARHTPELLRRLADALIASPQVRERLDGLQAQARRLDGRRCGADAVEAFLARRAAPQADPRMVPST